LPPKKAFAKSWWESAKAAVKKNIIERCLKFITIKKSERRRHTLSLPFIILA